MKQKRQISLSTILQRNPDQLFATIDDEVVMLIIESEEYLNLNELASYIWQQLEFPYTYEELIIQLCSSFNVEKKDCIEDTKEFIEKFIEKGIIQIVHETS